MSENAETSIQNPPVQGKFFDNYSTVDVREATGTLFLGILAVILLILLARSHNRYVALLRQMSMSSGEIDSQ